MREAEAQGGVGEDCAFAEIAAQRVDVLDHLLLAVALEIELAEIAGREFGRSG